MKSFYALLLASVASARVFLSNSNYSNIEVGTPFEITWSDAEGPVTLTLKQGPKDGLQVVTVIATGQTGESYSWTPTNLPTGTYAIEIDDGVSDPNYSPQFPVAGTTVTSTRASSTPAPSSSAAPSTSATPTTSSATPSITSSSAASSSESKTSSSSKTSKTSTTTSTTATVPDTNAAATLLSVPVLPLIVAAGAALF